MTGGGPGTATEPLSLYAFIALMQRLRFGYGSRAVGHGVPADVRVRARLGARARALARRRARMMPRGGARPSRPAGCSSAACSFPIYWMVVASLTPESRLFESRPLVPAAVTLEHYRALFDERDFLVPDPQLARRRRADDARGRAGGRAVCVRARAPAVARPGLLLALDPGGLDVPADLDRAAALPDPARARGCSTPTPDSCCPTSRSRRRSPSGCSPASSASFRAISKRRRCSTAPRGCGRCGTSCCRWRRLASRRTAILTFLYCWNEFLFALSFTLGPERYTVPVAITLFRGRYQVPWGAGARGNGRGDDSGRAAGAGVSAPDRRRPDRRREQGLSRGSDSSSRASRRPIRTGTSPFVALDLAASTTVSSWCSSGRRDAARARCFG